MLVNGSVRLEHPPGGGGITQISATPRHILSVTNTGECWTHEEGKVRISHARIADLHSFQADPGSAFP